VRVVDYAADVKDALTTITVGECAYSLYLPQASDDTQVKLAGTHRPFEERMLQDMASALKPNDLVVDVGAGFGNDTLYLAAVAGCRVLAYEPNAVLVAGLRRSVDANDLGGLITIRDAVVGLDGEQFPARVAALKINVTGVELEVLRGAQELIARDRPLIFIESGRLDDFREICVFANDAGYVLAGMYNSAPALVLRPAAGTPEEREVAGALVAATERLYALILTKQALRNRLDGLHDQLDALHDRLAEQTRDHAAQVAQLAERIERGQAKTKRLEALLSVATSQIQRRLVQGSRFQELYHAAEQQERMTGAELAAANEQLKRTRGTLARVRTDRDALRGRRAIKIADRVGRIRRAVRWGPSGRPTAFEPDKTS